jgi:hypothetical protein
VSSDSKDTTTLRPASFFFLSASVAAAARFLLALDVVAQGVETMIVTVWACNE